MQPDNVILTGFMGTGKSTAGRLLAKRLGLHFVDTDDLIVERDGRSIQEIFNSEGETGFRAWEERISRELARERGLVIATGGRLMLEPENAALLGATGPVFCLAADPADIYDRLAADATERPLLAGAGVAERISSILRQRAAGYARFRRVNTSGQTPEAVAGAIAALIDNGLRERLTVTHPTGSYDIWIGRGLLPETADLAGVDGPLFVLTDSEVGPLYAGQLGANQPVLTMPAGERYKTLETVSAFYDGLLAAGLDRKGTVAGLGGGVVGDVAGYTAATILRGVAYVGCPTSLLAMVDASVGGKTGVDLPQGKNLVGAFKQPLAVIADVATLSSLPPAEFTAGMAEIAKHGLIASPVLWQRLLMEDWTVEPARYATDRLLGQSLQALVTQAIEVKHNVVEEDPFEHGRRAVLNLGHTFAHAIEQVSGYAIRHGDAVAIGLVAAANLSARLGQCDPTLPDMVEMVLTRLGLPTHIPPYLKAEALYAAMGSDKKKEDGRLGFILLHEIGDVFISRDVPEAAVLATLQDVTA